MLRLFRLSLAVQYPKVQQKPRLRAVSWEVKVVLETLLANNTMNNESTRPSDGRHHGQRQNNELTKEEIGLDEIQAPPPDRNLDHGPRLESNRKSSAARDTEETTLSKEESGLDELFAPHPTRTQAKTKPTDMTIWSIGAIAKQNKRKLGVQMKSQIYRASWYNYTSTPISYAFLSSAFLQELACRP